MKVYKGVGSTDPRNPRIKKAITNRAKKTLLGVPLYLIERTGDLSNQGNTKGRAMAPAITTSPQNFASRPNKGKVAARNIE